MTEVKMVFAIVFLFAYVIEIVTGAGRSLESLSIAGNAPVEQGRTAEISCDYRHSHAIIVSTQWFKYDGDVKTLVYSFVRDKLDEARDSLAGRAELKQKYGRFSLLIHDMQLTDEALYQCQLFQSYSSQLTSKKYVLEVAIPAKMPAIDSQHYENGTGVTVRCSGNVGRPGGSLSLYRRRNGNWTELETIEIQRIYANHTVTTFVKSNINTLYETTTAESLQIRCQAKNDADTNKVFITEKFIRVPVVAGDDPTGYSSDSEKSFHVAGYTTIVLLILSAILFILYILHRFSKISLTRCIKRERSSNEQSQSV